MVKQKALFLEIDSELSQKLDEIKQREDRSGASIVRLALKKYISEVEQYA